MNDIDCFFFFSSRRRHTRYWRDWSSDVCSSDLRRLAKLRLGIAALHYRRARHAIGKRGSHSLAQFRQRPGKIGRASCREREEISVVAVSFKKKKSIKNTTTSIKFTNR